MKYTPGITYPLLFPICLLAYSTPGKKIVIRSKLQVHYITNLAPPTQFIVSAVHVQCNMQRAQ